jgi:hypothetical protein
MPTNDRPANKSPPEPELLEIGLAEHFVDVLVVVVPPSPVVVVVVVLPPMLLVTIAEKLAATEPLKVASMCSTYHEMASVTLASLSTISPLQTMAPPPNVALQFFEQSSGVTVQVLLLVTWHITVHWILSTTWQLVAQAVAQLVVAGAVVHSYEHWAEQSVSQSAEEAAPQLSCAEQPPLHCAPQ